MSPELLFDICNKFVLPAWALLMFLPKWEWTKRIIFHAWIPILLGVAYIYAFASGGPTPEGGGFGSLEQVMVLFASPHAALAGWIHYLAFDLFIGAWEVRDSQRNGVSHWLVIPCLILTFLGGTRRLAALFCDSLFCDEKADYRRR